MRKVTTATILWCAAWLSTGGAACVNLLGNDFEIGPDTTAGGGTTTSHLDGGGGTAASGAGGGGAHGGGAGGGGGAGPCALGTYGSCGAGKKCTVVDTSTGATGCITAGPHQAWSLCAADSECEELTYCEKISHVCKPLCVDAASCLGDGVCLPAKITYSDFVTGLSVCSSDCDPLSAVPCDDSYGPSTCQIVNIPSGIGFDCIASTDGPVGTACTPEDLDDYTTECADGLACIGSGQDLHCLAWCTPIGAQAQCSSGVMCTALGMEVLHQGVSYGYCPP
jgi:hypothetical protein